MILVFAVAQLLDVLSALSMPVEFEANPLMRMLLDQPVAAIGAKVALVVLGIACTTIIARKKPRLARTIYPIGSVAGMIGLASNLAVLRALAEG